MKIAILGFAREGKSVLKFLKKHPRFKKAAVSILDQKFDKNYLAKLHDFELVFRSPGVPYNLPEIQKTLEGGVKFSSATKLFFDLCPAKIIGVTGTKGKGTTSTLIYQILKNSGRKVLLAGNIGKSALEILPKAYKKTLVVLELSSFQLQDLEKSPAVAVITEIFPDHMDVHKNMAEYLDTKANICRHQKKSDAVFYFANNALARKLALKSTGKKIAVSARDNLGKNRLLAAAVARYLGCSEDVIQKTINNFSGMEHRLELITKIGGIKFYNDSASTNPQTTAMAIRTLSQSGQPIVLIAGGKDKNLDYAPLAQAIKKSGRVKTIILMGENKDKIRLALSHEKALVLKTASLKSAVKLAYQIAKSPINQLTNKQINILFSPGAASFDMFKDYADRGKQFKKIVKKIKSL